jgi:hypothetical protein
MLSWLWHMNGVDWTPLEALAAVVWHVKGSLSAELATYFLIMRRATFLGRGFRLASRNQHHPSTGRRDMDTAHGE